MTSKNHLRMLGRDKKHQVTYTSTKLQANSKILVQKTRAQCPKRA